LSKGPPPQPGGLFFCGKAKLDFQRDDAATVEPLLARLYTLDELTELRRNTLRYARSFPPGDERNQHRQLAISLRMLFKGENWLRDHVRNDS